MAVFNALARFDVQFFIANSALAEFFASATVTGGSSKMTFVETIDGITERLVFTGTFSNFVDGVPTSGTIRRADYSITGGEAFNITGMSMSVEEFTGYVNTNDILGLFTALFAGADTMNGSGSDDVLDGFAGNDLLKGGDGNDTLLGSSGIDRLVGGAGDDILMGGIDNDTLYGGAGNDQLHGGDGDDYIDGGAGIDTAHGGLGNDLYFVDVVGDTIVEAAGAGIDLVRSGVTSITLSDNVENLMITYGRFDGTGNALGNEIVGSDFINTLDGLGGNDKLRGKGGNDILRGGDGDDYLAGNTGQDNLTGGTGADRFAFLALNESTAGTFYADTIADFSRAEADKIILTGIDAIAGGTDDRFAFIGSAAFTGTAGQLRYSFDARGDTLVQMDVNGDGVADMSIRLTGQIDLVASDFLL